MEPDREQGINTVCGELHLTPKYPENTVDPSAPSVIREEGAMDTNSHAHLYPKEPRTGYAPSALKPLLSREKSGGDYFILRSGVLEQAIKDVKTMISDSDDGEVQGVWILTVVDHWNQDQERLVLLTENSLLICMYDFVGLCSSQLFRVPLNFIDTVFWGPFTYPSTSLNKREGQALRIQWDKLRQPSFLSRWNPWANDLPYLTFTQHPVAGADKSTAHMSQLEKFKEQLVEKVKGAHSKDPLPGRANGLLVLEKPIAVDTYVGLLSLISSKAELGYSKSRGLFGF